MELKKLSDQTIVITGASSGIGLVTARKAAARGARVVLASRSEDALSALSGELTGAGHEAAVAVADVGDFAQVQKIALLAKEKFGGFDTWINNAGVSIYGSLSETSLQDHRRLFETNYWGLVHGSLVAADHLSKRGGAIINLGSVYRIAQFPFRAHIALRSTQ